MDFRVIREGMKEAHQNVDNFGGVWYVLDDRFKSVVKQSYFITDEGDRKVKPFVSLYNTKDMKYGRHTVQWIDGEIVIDPKDVKKRFFQPYDTKFVLEKKKDEYTRRPTRRVVMIGDAQVGFTHSLKSLFERNVFNNIERVCMPDSHATMLAIERHDRLMDEKGMITQIEMDKFLNDLPPMNIEISDCRFLPSMEYEHEYCTVETKRFDMSTGKVVEDKINNGISNFKRGQLRKKRKKRRR